MQSGGENQLGKEIAARQDAKDFFDKINKILPFWDRITNLEHVIMKNDQK